MKDGSSLIVTPSSIPNFATRGPNVDLSSEGSEDVLEDSDDEPVSKKRISDSDERRIFPSRLNSWVCAFLPSFFFFFFFFGQVHSSPFFCHLLPYTYVLASPLFATISLYLYAYFPVFADTFEGPGVVADVSMPSATALATPIAPVSAIPTVPVSPVPSVPVSAVPIAPIPTGPGEFLISSLISFSQVYYS